MHVVVVGSGFAGSILARVARAVGHDATLVERGAHPRFTLGESSTPLAAIALERLAARYGLDDLHALAAYGRWSARLPELRRGLKRGFTFYRHERKCPFDNDESNRHRLLVAASPDDAVADAHWLRADVDHFLVRRAVAEGVRYLDRTELDALEPRRGRFLLSGTRRGESVRLTADLVVDATGPDGFVARQLGPRPALAPGALHTGLIYGHFGGVRPLRDVAGAGAAFPDGPFPDEQAAVHHLLDEGWLYELAFDDGVVSAGFVVEGGEVLRSLLQRAPADAFRALARRYPSLAAQYESARAVRPVAAIPRLQRRLSRAAGAGWALLPHVLQFWSPLFSTGMAWSLLGVERLGLLLERATAAPASANERLVDGLEKYDALLCAEGEHLRSLIEPAYRWRGDFALFEAYVQTYFAAASFSEARQRLCPAPAETGGQWAWSGFLGATDPVLQRILAEAIRLLEAPPPEPPLDAVRRLIAPRNLAGLADPARRRLYPADVETLVDAADVLGMPPDEVRARLPRLRGEPNTEAQHGRLKERPTG